MGRRVILAVAAGGFAALALLLGARHAARQAAEAERLIICHSRQFSLPAGHQLGERAAATVTCTRLPLAHAGPGLLAWACVLIVLLIALTGFLVLSGPVRPRRPPAQPEAIAPESPGDAGGPSPGPPGTRPPRHPVDGHITQQRDAAVTRLAQLLPHLPGSLAGATESALRQAGATVVRPSPGDRFDPGWQEAVGRSGGGSGARDQADTVARVMAPAVIDGDDVLLPSRVVIGPPAAAEPGPRSTS